MKEDIQKVISEAGWAAYLACLQAGKRKRCTRNLGLPRATYHTEYAREAMDAVIAYLSIHLPDAKGPTMTLTDEQALELGRDVARFAVPNFPEVEKFWADEILMSLGRIAFKRSMELAKEMEK